MKTLTSTILTAALLAACGTALSAEGGGDKPPQFIKHYEVHEWGVMSVYPGTKYANCDMAAEWAELPSEVYGVTGRRRLPYRGAVRKPIVYFHWHSDEPVPARAFKMGVAFAEGRPMVWYPASVSYLGGKIGPHARGFSNKCLNWSFWLRNSPKRRGPAANKSPKVAADHWWAKARDVKCEKVYAYGSHSRQGTTIDTEDFIYYDGLMKPLNYLTARRDGAGNAYLDNTAPYDILDLFAVERKGGKLRLAFAQRVENGAKRVNLEWKTIPKAKWRAETSGAMVERLIAAGLHDDEAKSVVDIWRPGFFETDGLTLIYRLPQREYNRVTRITLDPVPGKLVRVGLICHPHAEPELRNRVVKLAGRLAGPDAEKCRAQLLAMGGPALDGLAYYRENFDSHKDVHLAIEKLMAEIDPSRRGGIGEPLRIGEKSPGALPPARILRIAPGGNQNDGDEPF